METKFQPVKVKGIKESEMPIAAFCSPQPGFKYRGESYPSKITLRHYKILADLGINLVYGHCEKIGGDNEHLVFKALDLAAKCGISYLVRDDIAEEYVSLGHREYLDFRKLDSRSRDDLDKRFIKSLRRYKDHEAFAGIAFFDEPGLDSFEGIAHAKRVFERECPDKLFYVNMLPNNVDARQLQYGANMKGVPQETVDELSVKYPNDRRYKYFVEKYLDIVRPQVFSYDSYPFLTLGNVESMIHISLYELQQFGCWIEKNYGIPYWLYMQIGGKWEGSATRVTDFAEMQLQFNLSLAYGAKGLQLFPTCFPNDWMHDPVPVAGVLDRYGKLTDHYHYLKIILKQVKACSHLLMKSHLKAILLKGEYEGLLPDESELEKILWNETIFRGKLPTFNNIERDSYGEIRDVKATSQFFIGCFDCEGSNLYYAVNNSIVTAANIEIVFDEEYDIDLIYKGESKRLKTDRIAIQRVGAGDGFLLLINRGKKA